jgi:hypothetical protein
MSRLEALSQENAQLRNNLQTRGTTAASPDDPIPTREKGKAPIRRHQSNCPGIGPSNRHARNSRSYTPRRVRIYSVASYRHSEHMKLSPKVKDVPQLDDGSDLSLVQWQVLEASLRLTRTIFLPNRTRKRIFSLALLAKLQYYWKLP